MWTRAPEQASSLSAAQNVIRSDGGGKGPCARRAKSLMGVGGGRGNSTGVSSIRCICPSLSDVV
jgi:hypothetical protein